MALKRDGTVWTWGTNIYGQLGNGKIEGSISPKQVKKLQGVKQIVASAFHTVALQEDGNVWAWGRNNYGQLGNGTTKNSNHPVRVKNLEGVKQITAGALHTVALKEDGSVWAWGNNSVDQLCRSDIKYSDEAVQIDKLIGVTQVSAGDEYTMALKEDGSAWIWGGEYNVAQPVGVKKIIGLEQLIFGTERLEKCNQIVAGSDFGLAIKEDGTIWQWKYDKKIVKVFK